MRIFLAGATGVIGTRLLPLLLADEHVVAAMTRTPEKMGGLSTAGVTPVLCDLYDQNALTTAVVHFRPDVVMHQVTDLPDRLADVPHFTAANQRARTEGTRNLLAAAKAAGASRFLAQSIAWGSGPVIEAHEGSVLAAAGTVLRYGRFHGPGPYYENELPPPPRVHIDRAARRTLPFLAGPSGVFTVVDEEAAS
jgi:nucleoside-diphosphate-sugar epimerase